MRIKYLDFINNVFSKERMLELYKKEQKIFPNGNNEKNIKIAAFINVYSKLKEMLNYKTLINTLEKVEKEIIGKNKENIFFEISR